MEDTSQQRIKEIIRKQRACFRSEATLDIAFRKEMLRRLLYAIKKWEKQLYKALYTDLHKSEEEAFLTEVSIVTGEIKNHLKHLSKWSRPVRRCSPVTIMPSSSRILTEPLGNTLIVAPWNYPFQLLVNPLVGAISAGCTAILKPSPYVPDVSDVLQKMIESAFDDEYVAVVQGHRDVNTFLLEQRFDLIFLTGSPELGKIAMEAAAKHLTPLVLELGGKSPCIVDRDADIRKAAMRIAWGKTLNGGQTCIAPDYLMIHEDIKEEFIQAFDKAVHKLHGAEVKDSKHYVRMVNDGAFNRVVSYLGDGKVVSGGHFDRETRYIEPTLLDEVATDSPVMTREIFGPIFPIVTFSSRDEVVNFVRDREKPLALYYFGKESHGREILRRTTSGGACINDTIIHIANDKMPFGGVGNSGMGGYHGIDSYMAFSHRRSVVTSPAWIDMPFKYMPYKYFSLLKKFLK